MIKRIISLLLILAFSCTFFACGKKEAEKPKATEEFILPTEIIYSDISLPYISTDSFDPYAAKGSLNRALIPVLYESLYTSSSDGKGRASLASSGEINGKSVDIKLYRNIKFSDGTQLIAKDVKDSFLKAKSDKYYQKNLKNFSDLKIIDNYTLRFTLINTDYMALNCLDFPVVKYSEKSVLGTAKYYLEYLEDIPYLQVNVNHRDFSKKWNKQVALYDMAGVTSPVYPFKANKISVFKHDLRNGDYINLSSKTVPESMNNLVYVGVNSKWKGSASSLKWVRQAINIGIDRNAVTAQSFLGQGTPTVTPYKNGNYQIKTDNLPSFSGEPEKAIAILSRNGYDSVSSSGERTNGSTYLNLNILVCTENEYKLTVAEAVKKSLQDLGFKVTITEKKEKEDFFKALNDGHYSLYIGETQLSNNYNLSEFFTEKGKLNYGINKEFFKEYASLKSGKDSTMSFIEAFETEVPFIPLFYRNAVISVNPNITGIAEGENIYSSVSNWKIEK